MSALFSTLLAVLSLCLIGYPLLKGSRYQLFGSAKPAKRNAKQNKEILLSTLGEIEFDYQMKKLSDQDYHELKNNYSLAVAAILKDEDVPAVKTAKKSKEKKGNLLSEIEQEIESELKAIDKQ